MGHLSSIPWIGVYTSIISSTFTQLRSAVAVVFPSAKTIPGESISRMFLSIVMYVCMYVCSDDV